MEEVASTYCKDDGCKDNSFSKLLNQKYIVWIIVAIAAVCLCSGGGFPGNCLPNPCCKPTGKGDTTRGGGGGGLLIALLLLAFLGNGSILGNNSAGNVNSNVINLGPEGDRCDDSCDDCCC